MIRGPEKHFGKSYMAATALNSAMNASRSFESSTKYTISPRPGKLPFRKSSKSKGNTQLITQESTTLEESFASQILTKIGNLRFDIFYHPYVTELAGALNTTGIVSLFEPPIDPGALVKALASGLSIGSVLSDLNSPTPLYRFTYILQKAMGLTQQVKSLGNQLLSAIEKGEA